MSNVIPLNARDFLAPRYWPLWLAFGLLRLMSMLPIPAAAMCLYVPFFTAPCQTVKLKKKPVCRVPCNQPQPVSV